MSRIETRHRQGWVGHVTDSIPEAFSLAHEAMDGKKPISIAYHGNIVDLLEYAVSSNIHIDLLSDQTSCHAVYEGGMGQNASTSMSWGFRLSQHQDQIHEVVYSFEATCFTGSCSKLFRSRHCLVSGMGFELIQVPHRCPCPQPGS